ncbi:acylphosphatase [Salisediminibacterium halotolerans]|uniref:acylphosphatase n=1 Tax=Salisediminibacterium halotolerans TaxID=517425 RepID=A0A1H9UH26_9BACI|nr:acylphosphatase [Salisediminibacterium haloalkalitolerans]SES08494.1 acylphosphatase [Salisediminibacterium haloalkalitolerans]
MIRYHAIIDGRVQGVGFRFQAQMTAAENDVTGWVQNKSDSTVELEAQGEQTNVDAFFSKLQSLPYPVKIKKIDKTEKEIVPGEAKFKIEH